MIVTLQAVARGRWNVIGLSLPPGPGGDTKSGGQGSVGACEGCRNTGLIARLIGTPASWRGGSWFALPRLISPSVPPLAALIRREKHHPATRADETGFTASGDIVLEITEFLRESFVEGHTVH